MGRAWRRGLTALVASSVLLTVTPVRGATTVKSYAVGQNGYVTRPLLSVGDAVPFMRDPGRDYRMVGIPDGLGVRESAAGPLLYMNHEFEQTDLSRPIEDGPEFRGAFVSKWLLDENGDPLEGAPAFRWVYQDNAFVGPLATTTNATPAFARFCSATMAGDDVGFTEDIYLTNEESDGVDTFDGTGGQTVAIFDNEAHALSGLGRFSKENNVVWPNEGSRTVVFSLEDGPTSPDSQLYMYVGRKNGEARSVLRRNGLIGGRLFVFVSTTSGKDEEADFTGGSIGGRWVEIPDADEMSDAELEAASDAAGAFGFVRIEDGAFAKQNRNDFFFVTTGGSADAGNALGRLYHLRLNQDSVLEPARLDLVYNADTVAANGGDTAVSPDNVDTSARFLMVQEDATDPGAAHLVAHGRDAGIWRFRLDAGPLRTTVKPGARRFVAEVDPPGSDGVPVPTGEWETSGIVDTSGWFGRGTWLFDVQAHGPTTAPELTVEDGQLLLLRRAS
jgi:glycerophosphoryl diester phosphodiesterase